jgi:hypothetical protein
VGHLGRGLPHFLPVHVDAQRRQEISRGPPCRADIDASDGPRRQDRQVGSDGSARSRVAGLGDGVGDVSALHGAPMSVCVNWQSWTDRLAELVRRSSRLGLFRQPR